MTGTPASFDTARETAISGLLDQISAPSALPDEPLTAAARAALQILVVDDERTVREGCASILRAKGYRVFTASTSTEALDAIRRARYDLVLADLFMTPMSGMDVLASTLRAHRDTLVVMITGKPSVSSNIAALRGGAWDYLAKPFTATQLLLLVGRAAHQWQKAREARAERLRLLDRSGNSDRLTMIGISPAFRRAVALARKVAPTDAPVMILGEAGSGKELLAQLIHRHSHRADRRLVAVDCAALSEQVLESELFGQCANASGTECDRPGLLEMANEGTCFLGELARMPLSLQAKLLRVLQEGVLRRVGGDEDVPVNVRFISAMQRSPQDAVGDHSLREDLLYRLGVVPIELPPLRERLEDIPLLASHFLSQFWERHRGVATPAPELSDSAIALLRSHPWRGNVRELQNVIEHLAVIAEPGQRVQADQVPLSDDAIAAAAGGMLPASVSEPYHNAKDRLLSQFERLYVTRLLDRVSGNLARAARLAGIDRVTLYRLMEKHGLQREEMLDHLS